MVPQKLSNHSLLQSRWHSEIRETTGQVAHAKSHSVMLVRHDRNLAMVLWASVHQGTIFHTTEVEDQLVVLVVEAMGLRAPVEGDQRP